MVGLSTCEFPKVHYCAHNSLTLVSNLRHRNAIYTLLSYFSNTHFSIILPYVYVCLPHIGLLKELLNKP